MARALIDCLVVDERVDALVDTISLSGWVVERPGQQRAADGDKVIRYLGLRMPAVQRSTNDGASLRPLQLRFVVGTVTEGGDGGYVSNHHAGAGVSEIARRFLDVSFAADGHVGGFDDIDVADTELTPGMPWVERVVTVYGHVQRASGRTMQTVA